MRRKRAAAGILAAGLLLSSIPACTSEAAGVIPKDPKNSQGTEDTENTLEIWFDEPTDEGTIEPGMAGAFDTTEEDNIWQQLTLPIGNGSIGANIYGNVQEERLTFNEKTLWNGGPSEARPDYNGGNIETSNGTAMSDIFSQIQQCYREGRDDEAANLAYQLVGAVDGYGAYQSWGDIYLDYGFENGDYASYERALDMTNAVSTVDFEKDGTKYHREYFVSYPNQVLAMKLTAEGESTMDLDVSFPVDNAEGVTDRKLGKDAAAETEGNRLTVSGELQDNQMMFNGQLLVAETEGGTVEPGADGESLEIRNASEVVIYVAADTNYEDTYPDYRTDDTQETLDARVAGFVDAAAEKGYDQVRADHEADYKEIFDRVSLDLGQGASVPAMATDDLVRGYKEENISEEDQRALETMLFQYGRYLTIASSRDGDLPSNLQGIWQNRVGDANRVPWASDYHMNVNLQMNYWPVYSTNMIECATPLIDYVNALKEPGEVTAQIYFGVEEGQGFTAHTQNTPFGWTCPGWSFSWGWSPAALPWILQNCYEYYEYSGDVEYLRENIYPLLKECALLYDNILMEKDGRLVSAPAYSPEHGPITAGNTYEQSLIWQLYEDTIHAAEVLGVDADKVAEWKETQSMLKPIEIGESGQIKEWYTETTLGSIGERGHRHMSHLLGLFPGDLINVDNAEYMDAAIVSLEDRGYNSTGWGIGQRINAWARTGNGDNAYRCIQTLFENGVYPNLWDCGAPFQIDGNFGYTSGVAEMLLQSNVGYINILPALPKEWSDGHVSGLVARGNFEVSVDWKDMAPYQIEITSRNGGEAVVQAGNLALATVIDEDGNPVSYRAVSEDRISFETEQGRTYRIVHIPGDENRLEAVSGLAAVRTGEKETELTWGKIDGESVIYTVYRQIDNGDVQILAENVEENSYTDEHAEEVLGTIKYQVQAVQSAEGETVYGELSDQVQVRETVHRNGMVDDREEAVSYEGGFSQYGEDGLYDGTSTVIEQPEGSESIEMTFEGTGISVYATAGPDRGMMDVYIDGEKHGTADCYQPSKQNFSQVYRADGLDQGIHTVRLELTNTKNDSSTKTKMEFDAFEIENSRAEVSGISVSGKDGVNTIAIPGSSWQMEATVDTEHANKNVTWSVDNEALASIDDNGILTVKDQPGVVTVTAVSELDPEVSGETEIVLDIPAEGGILDEGTITEFNIAGSENNGGGTLNTEDMTWTGNGWSPWGESEHLNGNKVDGFNEGDTVSFTFTGTKLEIYGPINYTFSKFGVNIDGTDYEDVDVSLQESLRNQLLAVYEGLENTEHTVTITVKSKNGITKIGLDYIKTYAPIQSGTDVTTVIEDSEGGVKNPEIQYNGSWSPWSGGEDHHGGHKTESSTAGDTVTYRFYGTGIDVYAPTNPSTSGVFVTLDGEELEPICTYSTEAEKEYQKLVASYSGLDREKEHVLTLTVAAPGELDGSQNATRANFGLDYFVVHDTRDSVFSGIDKGTLQTALQENLDRYPEQYEEEGYRIFEEAFSATVDAMNNAAVSQEDADAAAESLRAASLGLTAVEPPKPDVSDMDLYVSGLETSTLMLIWSDVDDAVSYEIRQGEEVIGTTGENCYRVSGLTPDTEYRFTVNAVSRTGAKDGASIAVRTEQKTDETVPEQISDLAFDETTGKVTWTASTSEGIVSYIVWVNGTKTAETAAADPLEYQMSDLEAGEVYTVSVVAADQNGNTSLPVSLTFRYEEAQEPDKEISTAVLEYALSLAETADTEGVVDSVVKIFNDAKAAAEDILARVQAGDTSVTQEMVDESWQNLIKAMQYLSFKQGDKTDLQKVIDMARFLDMSKYLDEGQQAFTDALAAAEAVLANGDAMQDEVDQSWRDLLKAMSELRLKPNKDALKDLIDEANAMRTKGADEETIAAFQNALASAMSVYDNEQATEEEVMTAEEGLQAALDQLRAAVGDTEDPDNSGDDGSAGSGGSGQDQSDEDDQNSQDQNDQIVGSAGDSSADTSGKDNASAQTDTAKNNSAQKSVKTGDTAAPIAGMAAAMMLAAAAGVMAYRRRRETR